MSFVSDASIVSALDIMESAISKLGEDFTALLNDPTLPKDLFDDLTNEFDRFRVWKKAADRQNSEETELLYSILRFISSQLELIAEQRPLSRLNLSGPEMSGDLAGSDVSPEDSVLEENLELDPAHQTAILFEADKTLHPNVEPIHQSISDLYRFSITAASSHVDSSDRQ